MGLTNRNQNQTSDELLLKETRYKSFPKIVLMVLNICFSPFYFGYGLSYLGTFDFNTIINIFGITMDADLANGLIQGCIPVGAGIGSLSSFLLIQNLSRKNSFLLINGVAIIISILSLIPNQYLIFFTRFMQGICIGLYSALAPLMIKELSPTEISGSMGALNQFSIAFGVFFSNFLQFILNEFSSQQDHWQILFGLPLITTIIQTLLFLFVYKNQTPKYLLERQEEEKCRQLLRNIYKEQFVEEVFNQKQEDLGISTDTVEPKDKQSTLTSVQSSEKSKPKKNMLRLLVAIHLAVLQQCVGINTVVAYGPAIVVKVFPDLKNLIPVLLNLQQTLTSITTSYLLSKFGRKTLLQLGTIVFVISNVIISIGFMINSNVGNAFVIIGLVIFMANFGLTLGPVVWLCIPEIIEPDRVPIAVGSNWGSTSIIIFLFPILSSSIGQWPLFMFFAGWCTVSFFVTQKFFIETKGKQEKQIYEQYEKMSK